MATTAATGFCRVTVVAPGGRIDVALPEDVPLSDIYPEIARLSGGNPVEGALSGYHLVRRDGRALEAGLSLAGNSIRDGDVLLLRPFADSLPAPVFDDVSDAVAAAVRKDRTLWSDSLLRTSGLVGGAILLVLMALALWCSDPVRHNMHTPSGIIAGVTGLLLTVLACVRARVYEDQPAAVALGLSAVPHLMIGGSAILPLENGEGAGRLQFLLGCVVVLVAAVVLIVVAPSDAPFVATAVAAGTGTVLTFVTVLTSITPTEAAAVAAPLAVGAVAFLPGLSARFARLPIGFEPAADGQRDEAREGRGPADAARIAAQARRGHEFLGGMVGGCCAVVLGSAAVLGFSGNGWGQLLALATGIAMLLRARLFRYTTQVASALVAGMGALALLGLGLALGSGSGDALRTVWLSASLAAGAAIIVAVGLVVPRKGLSAFWGRLMEMTEALVLLALIPLTLAVLDVYGQLRGGLG